MPANLTPRLGLHQEEHDRFEVLRALHRMADGDTDRPIFSLPLVQELGMEEPYFFQLLGYLCIHGFVQYEGVGPILTLTPRGRDYIGREARRRRTIREAA